ncbi:flagellar basal body-associated protein FliL [Jeotgalibacillus haloalkalitolerans]|uniref:Flagellar protein FliL n=1 Tax=Jeotgalibacillus haloalkalitolerans TaxID=3104292 RepID=A0ABU5KKF3_9BACL|nr:flagellar basal body-associated protein FliL [Jeotgalibacillus sp. HH7-29]MDZ5711728.1 flagellar basal body-associated protein FliL [Jeotgalibacillus sp. HH7-29]
MRSKNRLLITMLIILVSITLVGVIVLVVSNQLAEGGEKEEVRLSAAEIVEATVEVPEVTTNIGSNNFARVSMSIQTDSKEAAEELIQLEFQVKDILIDELLEMDKSDLEGSAGKDALEEIVANRVNELLQEGEVIQVYTTSIVVQ